MKKYLVPTFTLVMFWFLPATLYAPNDGPLLPYDMAVDANRDGEVELGSSTDKTTQDRPYVFWVNDDSDRDNEEKPSGTPDWQDGLIQCARDLEDFSRIKISVGGLREAFQQGKFKLGFEWKQTTGSPAVQIYPQVEESAGEGYLKDEIVAAAQIEPGIPTGRWAYVAEGGGTLIGTGQAKAFASLPTSIATRNFEEDGMIHLLFEGCGEGKGQLCITIHDENGAKIGDGPGVWLDLRSIRKMYSRGHSKPDASWQPPFDQNPYQAPTVGFEPLDSIAIEAPSDETDELIVFVHGIHSPGLNFNEATNVFTRDADTIFKRLWRQGFKGRFAFYKWDALNAINPAEYNQSEYRAWKCGRGLAQYVASLPGATKNLMAHSQGNNVICAALRDYGMQIDNYIIMQGAAPAFCYDENLPLAFSYTTPDHVNELGYRGYLPSTVTTRIVNFSNPNDSVTGIIWKLNQQFSKPDGTGIASIRKLSGPWYNYVPGNSAGVKCTLTYWLSNGRWVTDLHESTAMVVQSNSRSIAHTPQTGGLVADNVPMDTEFQFGNEHGSQFGRPIQQLNDFFDEVLQQFGLPFNP